MDVGDRHRRLLPLSAIGEQSCAALTGTVMVVGVKLDLTPMASDLHRLRIPSDRAHLLNCYLHLGETITLIDTGWPDSAPLITAAVTELGRHPAEIERIVLTHFHEDHAGSAAHFAQLSGAHVIAGRADADFVRGTRPGPPPVLTATEREIHTPSESVSPPPCQVDTEVGDGDLLDFAGGATVLAVPGHTPGSIAVHIPELSVVLTGDVAAEFHGEVITGAFHMDREQVHVAVQRLAATGATVAAFGHGEAVLSGAADRLARATDPLG